MTIEPTNVSEGLEPCPFCGGAAKRFTIEEEGDNFGGDVISCTQCCASSHVEFGRKENLVSIWNTRLSPPLPSPGVERESLTWARERCARRFEDREQPDLSVAASYRIGLYDSTPDITIRIEAFKAGAALSALPLDGGLK